MLLSTYKEVIMGIRISPFVRCTCGKIHIVLPAMSRVIRCPYCYTDLVDLMLRITK